MKKLCRSLQICLFAMLFLLSTSPAAFADSYGTSSPAATTTTTVKSKPVKYGSTDGNFSVTFPGTPEESSEDLKIDSGTVTLHAAAYNPTGNTVFAVVYSDVLQKPVSKKDAYDLLVNEEKGELSSPGAKLDGKDKKNAYKNYAGLYYKTRKDNVYGITQTYLVKTRLYQIVITKDNHYPTNREIKSFMGSFKLLNPNPSTPNSDSNPASGGSGSSSSQNSGSSSGSNSGSTPTQTETIPSI